MRELRQRALIVIAACGIGSSALVAAAGLLAERVRLGATDADAFGNVKQIVLRQFEQMTASIERMATAQAAAAEPILGRPNENRDLRPLFDQAARLVAGASPEPAAVTVYSNDLTPLAWAGRPSELAGSRGVGLSPDRVSAPSALFVAPGPLGFRLVRLEPVTTGSGRPPGRVGIVAAERVFPELSVVENASPDRFRIETPLAPVTLRIVRDPAPRPALPFSFVVKAPDGEPLVEAVVDPAVLRAVREGHRRIVWSLAVAVLGLTALLLAGPLLDRRAMARTSRAYLSTTVGVAALVVLARLAFAWALPEAATGPLSSQAFSWPALGWLGRHPADFLLTGLTVLGLVALAAAPLERRRLMLRGRRWAAVGVRFPTFGFVAWHLAAGLLFALAVLGYEHFLAAAFRRTTIDILRFSPHPWDTPRMALALGLLACHAAFAWLSVLLFRLLLARWRFRQGDLGVNAVLVAAWAAPVAAVWTLAWNSLLVGLPRLEALLIVSAVVAALITGPRGLSRLRRASQGYRLIVGFFALLMPALVMYPSIVFFHEAARQRAVETVYGPEVLKQRENLDQRLTAAKAEIDAREAELVASVSIPKPAPGIVGTDRAFLMWQGTALERYRVSSAVELYNRDEILVSRFALNLPEDTRAQRWREEGCTWRTFGEISPFGSHERQFLHAGRNICAAGGVLGTIVIHVSLDNRDLSFISPQNPYLELLRGRGTLRSDDVSRRDLEYVFYGWSRTALFHSGDGAWPIDDGLFARIYASRRPFWTVLRNRDVASYVYLENDRSGIYALGYPVVAPIGHLINLAELSVLAAMAYVALLVGAALFRAVGARRVRTGRALLREIRESFYRKLFLAFVAVSVVPVVALALVTRVYVADRLRDDVESAAHKTTTIARQIIEDYAVTSQESLSDDSMVGLSRVISQDVNVYAGWDLLATSERDLFESGLLSPRTPADVYRAIALDRLPTAITEDQVGDFSYLVAATPLKLGERATILTIPMTLRQQEIDREIDDLNRRIVLAALLFILFGAAIGYPMAERIADPVNRLTRATRRIARGDFDARVAATSSDELRRLVEAFNRMAAELQRQRGELERTNRLEAWAEMARQVAHDIKNPLTPIQLSAEHLRRVHADRGKPLEPVLEGCVDSILVQVRLLRQLASEFSSFATAPTARFAPTDLAELVDEVVRPYEAGGSDRWRFVREFDAALPRLMIDRTLIGRALTNVVDNALHAMPGGGTVGLTGRIAGGQRIELIVTDTGVGMDEEALQRLFEPYFSTKAVGTGLGLSIARRNVELNGGTIAVESARGAGTRVTITLPSATPAPQ